MTENSIFGQSAIDFDDDRFIDGQNLIIPDNTELECDVTDAYYGIEVGKANMVCFIYIKITTHGEFFGQKYKYSAKIFDNTDAAKRDLAIRNMQLLDGQAGCPMTNARLPLSTENIINAWVGKCSPRVKFGLFISEDGQNKEINFIRGFAFNRKTLIPTPQSIAHQQANQQVNQQANQQENQANQQASNQHDKDVDFDDDIAF